MGKYSSLFVIIVGVIILFIVFGGDLSNSDEKNKKLVSDEDNIIGIWKSTKCIDDKSDNSSIEEAAIQFEEDGNCHFARVIVADGSSTRFEQRNDGLCYLNESKTKLKMEKADVAIIDWEKFSNSGSTMTIGLCTYSKVA